MTPPDRLEPFELMKLLHAQRLDFSHEQVGELLAEVERLRGAVAEEREACARVAEFFVHPMGRGCCNVAGEYIAKNIRARGDGK